MDGAKEAREGSATLSFGSVLSLIKGCLLTLTVETAELHKFVTNFVGLLIYWDPCSMERVERA